MGATHNGFQVSDNADGSHTLHDVPVFFACERDGEEYTPEYLSSAFDTLRSWEKAGHLPPMTLGHRMASRPEPRGAGFWRATRIGSFAGRAAIFADLTYTDSGAWEDTKAKRLLYLSCEPIRPGKGEPEIESLALLSNAPFLKLPMIYPASGADVANATPDSVTMARPRGVLSPVMAFASFGGREVVVMETPVAEATTVEKPRYRLNGDGTYSRIDAFAGDVPPKPDADDKPAAAADEQEKSKEPAEPETPKAESSGGMSEAVALITKFMSTPVPLQDMVSVIQMLEAKLSQLKQGSEPKPETEESTSEPEGDPDAPGARPSDDPASPSGKNRPPPGGKEPMNMSADTTAKPQDFAKIAGQQAALEGRIAAFEQERDQERAIFSAIKELADFNIGGDPEAKIRKVVTDGAEHWKIALATFASTAKETAPRRRGGGAAGRVVDATNDATTPEAVRALNCKTPEEATAAIHAFSAWDANQKRGLFRAVDFPTFFRTNRAHFGAPVA